MTISKFNISERRGMIVIIGILLTIVLTMLIIRTTATTSNPKQCASIDSIARGLQLQVEKNKKVVSEKNAQTQKKKKLKHQKKKLYIERNPLNEPLPTN